MRLKELRLKHGYTQKELAEKLGYKQNTISQWEKGTNLIGPDVLIKIADFYGVTTDYILERPEVSDVPIDPLNNKLLNVFNSLNDFGKLEVINRVNELAQLTKYVSQQQIPIAAHNDEQLTAQEIELMQQDIEDL